MEQDLDNFGKAFKEFIRPHHCRHHNQNPTFVCIDTNCRNKGLICSLCLTINGSHKNHDSIEIHEFMANSLKAYRNDSKRTDLSDMLGRIEESYEELLKTLTDFHENFSNIIKEYISKKNEVHEEKQSVLFTESSLETLKACKFANVEDFNKALLILISRMSANLEINEKSEEENLKKMEFYLEDLNYETEFIGSELKKF